MAAPVFTEHIVMTPGVLGGKPRIAGTRVRVHDIVVHHLVFGVPVREIVGEDYFPSLTEADVHAALVFYYDNRELITSLIAQEEQAEDEFRIAYPARVANLPRA